jgi:hypothetical protein
LLVQRATEAPAPTSLTFSGGLRYPAKVDARPPDRDRHQINPGDSEPIGQGANLIGLLLCERISRVIEAAGLNRLDLYGHSPVAKRYDEVDFTTAYSNVTTKDPGLPALKKRGGDGFAGDREQPRSQS